MNSSNIKTIQSFLSRRGRRSKHAFTVVEMLVVVLILGLVVAAIAPMVFSTLTSTRLTSAGETLAAQISLARQLALSRNETVEFRLYKYEDPESPGSREAFHAAAIMRVRPSQTAAAASTASTGSVLLEQLTDTYFFPSGIVLGESTVLSPVLSSGVMPDQADRERIIKRSPKARYKAFRFSPDGSTNLTGAMGGYYPNRCYVTLVEDGKSGATATVPKNFYAVQIDPATGKTSTYRP